ncbi:MAG: bifunctional 4-hydroxy-2-oxoglutarate aldolase/2-dehydro-3-deoxy-phosphogluconate aldolase [Terrimicrobiaceae bacterium]|nr:bifunctional 4-hydroxy-2-oxoglutarate aldolase/2-dehydro-3-deoxy-phosphogluconate aldolase [Terrimicrobiaceae bacterium]
MSSAFDASAALRVRESGIVAVLVLARVEDGPPLAKALLAGGVNAIELTLRTDAALGALEAIRREVPEILAGAGTVLTAEQVARVKEAGAAFAVAPGFNSAVVSAAREAGLPFAPGVATPSEIEAAVAAGCRLLKFFPAEPLGGLGYLKSAAAPYLHLGLEFIPLGGVSAKNLASYASDPLIAAVGGSWLAPREAIRSGDWPAITALAREAREIITQARGSKPRS